MTQTIYRFNVRMFQADVEALNAVSRFMHETTGRFIANQSDVMRWALARVAAEANKAKAAE